MSRPVCRHKTMETFRALPYLQTAGGPGCYRCSSCGEEFWWEDDKSSYWGNIECKHCCRAAVDSVACSPKCAEALGYVERERKQWNSRK